MKRLLFIKHRDFNARTIDNDLAILQEKFIITKYSVNTSKGFGFFAALFKQFFYLLFNIYRFEAVFIWFADYHSLLPVFFAGLFRKKSIVNIGGYDADEILIGSSRSLKEKFRRFCVLYTVKKASKLLPVSDAIRNYLRDYADPEKCETMYCCVDTGKFRSSEKLPEKENLVITVGGGGDFVKEAQRKRLDYFIELGRKFNELYPGLNTKFFAIGHNKGTETYEYLSKMISTPNVELKPTTSAIEELTDYYKRASVYMQLSYYEAFGIAQVEAMLFGCIPVSNPGGAIAEVVGDAGFLIKDYNTDEYILKLKEILDRKHEGLRQKAKERAIANFSLEHRKVRLLKSVEKLLKTS